MLDVALLGLMAYGFLQVVPMPGLVLQIVSPSDPAVRAAMALEPPASGWLPLSIDPWATAWASLVAAGAISLFFGARATFAHGGVRRTARGISAIGLAASFIAIAQAATAGRLIYWRYPTEYEGPLPFGPFVNRNHFGTWVIMAAPVCLGYLLARTARVERADASILSRRTRFARMADGRRLWLTAAGAGMIGALLLSLSRSGVVSLAAATLAGSLMFRQRTASARGPWLIAAVAITIGLGISQANLPALADRFTRSGSGVGNRVRIWRDTVPIIGDFWLTGTGEGTYRTSMLYYQRGEREVQFNQAHNHYLQALSEGGLIAFGLLGCAVVAFVRTVRERVKVDGSAVYWIRAGAATGLMAAALQSLWETGLTMPANAALASVLAAIAVHERSHSEKSIFRD